MASKQLLSKKRAGLGVSQDFYFLIFFHLSPFIHYRINTSENSKIHTISRLSGIYFAFKLSHIFAIKRDLVFPSVLLSFVLAFSKKKEKQGPQLITFFEFVNF